MLDLATVERLSDVVRVQAQALGSKVALKYEGRDTTYAELDKRANRVARQLIAAGVRPGARVGLLAKNSDRFYELLFGCAKARAALAPVNFRLAAPEVAFILADAGVDLLFVGADFVDLATKALAEVPRAVRVVALDGDHPDWEDYAAWRDAGIPHDPNLVAAADDDVIQLYTSGTTGLPKGVQLTNANYRAFMRCAAHVEGFRYDVDDAVLNAMPLFHVAGVNVGLAGLAQGSTVVVLKDLVPAVIFDLVARERINHAFFVPAVILMLLNTPEIASADLSSLKTIAYGASPISEDVLLRAQARFGCRFLQFYGMTETAGAGTYLPPEAHDPAKGKLRSCGIPWHGMAVKVVDAAGAEVPTGAVGEILIQGGMIMKGYWNRPEASAEALASGWMRTGDAGYFDADGYLFIFDRVKDMIVTGGENVYPAEVENALFGHPHIADVAVIGVPDDTWGEAVKALVVPPPGVTPDAAAIIAHARERVANYKVPKSVEVVAAIPRNPSGKVLRRELRKPYWEGRDRMVG